MTDYTKNAWKYYEYGKAYNNSLVPNQYTVVNTNTEFFAGNQWLHMPDTEAMRRLARPTFNIIKRVTSLFVASMTSSNTTITFEPLSFQNDAEAASFATAEVRNLLEKFKLDYRIRDALFDGAITGDYAAHFFWNPNARPYGGAFGSYRGEIEMEMVDGINVMFGNPNCADVEKQPYILIVGRDTVENLEREAAFYGGTDFKIQPDTDSISFTGVGGRTEIHGDDAKTAKALYVYMYTKEYDTDGTCSVHVTKATRTGNVFEDVDTGLTRYPLAWGNWQKQKNQYHGRALVTEIIPNQIFINQMMAMVFRHLQTQAFPQRLYNADLLPNLSNEVGVSIGVRNLMPGQDLGQVVGTIPASDMSNQIVQAINMCMEYTKECLGATDVQLGNVKPENTSALMVLQNSSEIPLENTRAGIHEWVEDIGAILLDMMGTYYGVRPIVHEKEVTEIMKGEEGQPLIDPMTGEMAVTTRSKRVVEEYNFSVFKNLWLNMSVDVGATTYYSEIAMVQTLDNLRRDGTLDVIEYLERLPDKLITRKQELIDHLKGVNTEIEMPKKKRRSSKVSPGLGTVGAAMSGELDESRKIAQMTPGAQVKINALPAAARRAITG